MEHTQNNPFSLNSIIALFAGLLGGMVKFFGQVPAGTTWLEKTAEAGGTALICGFLGVAGKELWVYVKRAYRDMRAEYKRKKNKP